MNICPNCKGGYSQSFNIPVDGKCVWCGYKLPIKKVKKNKKIVKENKEKVVIIVDGGNIQNIYSNFKDIDVRVLDLDNCKDDGKSGDEIVKIYNDMTKGLEEVSW